MFRQLPKQSGEMRQQSAPRINWADETELHETCAGALRWITRRMSNACRRREYDDSLATSQTWQGFTAMSARMPRNQVQLLPLTVLLRLHGLSPRPFTFAQRSPP